MRIEVNIEGLGAVQRALQRLGDRAADLRPAFREIGAGVVAESQLGFKESRDPYGTPWAALKASTIARRRKGSAKPLLDTGRLRNSITYRLLGVAGVDIGTNTRYAAIHQLGGRAGRGRKVSIPARTFIATRERGLPREYGEIIRDALNRHFARAGA